MDLLWRIQNLGQDVSGEDVRETQPICGIPPRGIYPHRSVAILKSHDLGFNLVKICGLSSIFQTAVVKFNDRRPLPEQINQLYFAVFQWRDPYIQQNKMVEFFSTSCHPPVKAVKQVFSFPTDSDS